VCLLQYTSPMLPPPASGTIYLIVAHALPGAGPVPAISSPAKLHKNPTKPPRARRPRDLILMIVRGAFVVQLRKSAPGRAFEGMVEEVDTGQQARFLSDGELIDFLRKRFAQALLREDERKKTNEPDCSR
jgi:hypothetical protein